MVTDRRSVYYIIHVPHGSSICNNRIDNISAGPIRATTHFTIREDRRSPALDQLHFGSLKRKIEYKGLDIARLRQKREQDTPLSSIQDQVDVHQGLRYHQTPLITG